MSKLLVNEIEPVTPGAGIGMGAPNTQPAALLNMQSVNQGFAPPRMTTAQRNAIVGPFAGLTIYNTDTNGIETYDGTVWESKGIKSINGQTAPAQVINNGTAGTAPNFTQTGLDTNTLNIPFASSAGVTAGLISNNNFSYFNQKLNPMKNVLYVVGNGVLGPQDFNSLKDAVDSISTASSSNPFLVIVGPGVFVEQTITMKPFVCVRGSGSQETIIQASGSSQHVFVGADNSSIENLLITGAGTGFAGIFHQSTSSDDKVAFWAEDIRFGHNDTHVKTDSSFGLTSVFLFDCKIGDGYQFVTGFWSHSTSSTLSKINVRSMTSTSMLSPYPNDVFLCDGPGSQIVLNSVQVRTGSTVGNGIHVTNGGSARALSTNLVGFSKALYIDNVGNGSSLFSTGLQLQSNITDIEIDSATAFGTFSGSADHTKVIAVTGSSVGLTYLDSVTGDTVVNGRVLFSKNSSNLYDITLMASEDATMGAMEGGDLTPGSGFTVNVATGFGFLETEPEIFTQVNWGNTSITLSANQDVYLYFDNTSTLVASASFPDTHTVILLGRVVTNSTGVEIIDDSGIDSEHTSNLYDRIFRFAIGPIYSSGSIVSESGTRNLDVTSGVYYMSTKEFTPSGGSAISWTAYYQDGIGGWSRVSQNIVDNTQYDNGSGTLQPLSAGNYAKHALYVVGDGVNENYFLVYSQAQYTALTLAEQGNIPTPPEWVKEGVTLIAAVIVQQGVSLISEIRDERPRIGFQASGVSATTFHGNLLGLLNDDHPQYLLVNGSRAMTGALNMGTNNITNVGTVNGVTVELHASRHLPSGVDPVATAAPLSNVNATTTNSAGTANSLSRSDHGHAVDTGAASTQVPDQSNATGSSSNLARADHVHNVPTAAPVSNITASTTNSQGVAATFSRSDHGHAVSVGVPTTQTPDQANSQGSSSNLARADHVHNVPTGTPSTIGTANAQGTAAAFARQDHIHNHGSQTDPTQHAVATTLDNGFMSSTDKTKLDGIGGSRIIKSGIVAAGSFAGNPKTATVTFGTAFPSTSYTIVITGVDSRVWSYQSKLAASFVINANANQALTGEVSWTAVSTGETVE